MSDTFICGKCHNKYKVEDISTVPITTIGNGTIPTNAYLCYNCKNKVELKKKKRQRKDRIVNE